MITEHTVFTTGDGVEWTNRQEAENHQAFIDLTQFFRDGLNNSFSDMGKDKVAAMVWQHRDRVAEILARSMPLTDTEKLST